MGLSRQVIFSVAIVPRGHVAVISRNCGMIGESCVIGFAIIIIGRSYIVHEKEFFFFFFFKSLDIVSHNNRDMIIDGFSIL